VVIEPGDHVILFVMDKRQMPQVNALFQAGV
jgi:trk system potassium uptake protein TrkA